LHFFRFVLPLACALSAAAADYATYIGDQYTYHVAAIATDASGNTYATGSRSVLIAPPYGLQASPLTDIFVSKINPSGDVSLIARFGGKGNDQAKGIALDAAGNIYIVGSTNSPDFPLQHPLQNVLWKASNGTSQSGFLVKLDPNGNFVYSTYFGGSAGPSTMNAVAADQQGNAYVTGESFARDYPRTPGLPAGFAAGPGPGAVSTAVFAKISPAGDKILYAGGLTAPSHACGSGSSCFLSTLDNAGVAIAVDPSGNAYIGGNTLGTGLPATPGAFQTGGIGAFVAKVNSTGLSMAYVTYLGSANFSSGAFTDPGNWASALAVDAAGNAYVTGYTSDANFPATPSAFQTTLSQPGTQNSFTPPPSDAFVAKLNAAGSAIVWATFLGGTSSDQAKTIALDPSGNIWVSGITNSSDFPLSTGFPGGAEFLAEFNPAGSSLLYGSRLPFDTAAAALAVDSSGAVHIAGAAGVVSSTAAAHVSAPRLFGLADVGGGDLAGRIEPGELISIYGLHLGPATPIVASFDHNGFLPTTLGSLQVSINGILAPLLYVSDTQINAVAPIELGNTTVSSLVLTTAGVPLAPFRLVVDPAVPRVLRHTDETTAAINQDGTVNSPANPAKAGSYVSIWASGVGWNYTLADGQEQTASQSSCPCNIQNVTQNQPIRASYWGPAPGMVNGITQINFQVANPGDVYSLGGPNRFPIFVAP